MAGIEIKSYMDLIDYYKRLIRGFYKIVMLSLQLNHKE